MLDLLLILLFAFLGFSLGILTGLIPGFHVNNIALILLSATPMLLSLLLFLTKFGLSIAFVSLLLCIIIFATSITHTFINFIPSTFLGAPESGTALSVLPAHAMLLEGKGYQAVYLSAVGSFGAIVCAFIFLVPYRFIIGDPVNGYSILKQYMVYILIGISVLLIFTEHKKVPYYKAFKLSDTDNSAKYKLPTKLSKINSLELGNRAKIKGKVITIVNTTQYYVEDETGKIFVDDYLKYRFKETDEVTLDGEVTKIIHTYSRTLGMLQAVFLFMLAGIFGLIVLDLDVSSPVGLPTTVLFPALSGLFGLSTLVISLSQTPTIPKQNLEPVQLNKKESSKSIVIGSTAGSVVGFLPGLSAGVATVVAMLVRKDPEREQTILTLSAINTANSFFVLIALFLILRPRSGTAIVINQLIPIEQWDSVLMHQTLAYLLIGGLFAAILSFFATIYIGKKFAKIFDRIPYRKIISAIIIFITVMVFMFTGFLGLLILFVATSIGLVAPSLGIRRSHAMAVLLVPVIVMLW